LTVEGGAPPVGDDGKGLARNTSSLLSKFRGKSDSVSEDPEEAKRRSLVQPFVQPGSTSSGAHGAAALPRTEEEIKAYKEAARRAYEEQQKTNEADLTNKPKPSEETSNNAATTKEVVELPSGMGATAASAAGNKDSSLFNPFKRGSKKDLSAASADSTSADKSADKKKRIIGFKKKRKTS